MWRNQWRRRMLSSHGSQSRLRINAYFMTPASTLLFNRKKTKLLWKTQKITYFHLLMSHITIFINVQSIYTFLFTSQKCVLGFHDPLSACWGIGNVGYYMSDWALLAILNVLSIGRKSNFCPLTHIEVHQWPKRRREQYRPQNRHRELNLVFRLRLPD